MDDPRIEAENLAQARGEYEVADEMETAHCLQIASDELRQRLAEQEFRELLENAWALYVAQNGLIQITHRRHVDYFAMSDVEFLKYRGLIE